VTVRDKQIGLDTISVFWALAKWAVGQRLITEEQAQIIARVGTRKQGYWARHLIDLCGVIAAKHTQ